MSRKQMLLALPIILLIAQSQAVADEPAKVSREASQADAAQLTEIIVTAQKRSESILKTPVAVSAVDSEMIRRMAPRTATDIAMVAPALQVNTPNGQAAPLFSLRGVTQNDYSSMASGPIAIYVDEVYRSGPAFFSQQIYDLDRIEVLRGPQGTLYGKNATGGAINFVTAQPDFKTTGYLDLTAGKYGEYDTAGAFQTGLTDKLAIRIAFETSHSDGWQKNINPGGPDWGSYRDAAARISLLYRPSDALDMIFRVSTAHAGPYAWANVYNVYPSGIGGGVYTQFHNLYPSSNKYTDYFPTYGWQNTAATGDQQREDSASHDASLSLTWHAVPTFDVVSITAFDRGYNNFTEPNQGIPLSVLSDGEDVHGDQVSEDLRLVSHLEGRTNFLSGLYLSRDRLVSQYYDGYYTDIDFNGDGKLDPQDCLVNLSPSQLLYPDGCVQKNQFRQERRSIAIYGDATTKLTDTLSLIYGIRLTRDTLKVLDYSAATYANNAATPLFNTIPGTGTDLTAVQPAESRNWTKTTGRLGVEYKLPDDTLLYSTVSRGYRGGAVNPTAFNSPAEITIVPPEILDAADFGWKGEYLERRLQLMSEVFVYRYQDEQALSINPTTFLQSEVSVDRSTIYGGEVEVTAKPWSPLTLRLNVSNLHSKINEGMIDGVNLKGNELPLAPKFTLNGNVSWDVAHTTTGNWSLFVAERYVTQQYWDLLDSPGGTMNPYATTDARLTFDFAKYPLSVALYGKNLTDKEYFLTKADIPAFGYTYDHVGNPRTFGVNLHYTF